MPVDFEPYFLSEINPVLSAKLEDVVASIQKNKVCIKVCGENLNLHIRDGIHDDLSSFCRVFWPLLIIAMRVNCKR